MQIRAFWTGFVLIYGCLSHAHELLLNPSFENGVSHWTLDGFDMQIDFTQAHEGVVSAKCTGRTQTWQGPSQAVNLKPGGRYSFRAYIKLIKDLEGHGPQVVTVKIAISYVNGTDYFEVTTRLHVTPDDGWVTL